MSYCLRRVGVAHAVISADGSPGGMFQRYPIFERLITWTKLHAPVGHGTRAYEWFDWNSLLAEEPPQRALVREQMDGASYFPARAEMQAGLVAFAERASIAVRYDCAWEATRKDGETFVLETSDGDYRSSVIVFAIGMARPWKPQIPGLDEVPHYSEVQQPQKYRDKTIFIIGKRNSGFELADGLLPSVRQMILASPRPARISVITRSTAAARARYLQPYEDHVLGGGNIVLDASIEKVERTGAGFRVHARGTTPPSRDLILDVDEVIAATGFDTPLQDLPKLGIATFYQGRLPVQTPFWESATLPGIYFAGAVMQGAIGLKKYGIPSSSAAVHGFRYNTRVLANHIAEKHFGRRQARPTITSDKIVDHLLKEASQAPELWNQQSYLARVIKLDDAEGFRDEGVQPLAHFVDEVGPDAIAIAVETDARGDIHAALYLRQKGYVQEHLLPSDPFHDFETSEHVAQVASVLKRWIS